jgi:hypothetical protein
LPVASHGRGGRPLSFDDVVGIGATVYLSNADRNRAIARPAKDTGNDAELSSAVLSTKQLAQPVERETAAFAAGSGN